MAGNRILIIAALIAIIFSLAFALEKNPEELKKEIYISELELLQESYNSSTTEYLIDDLNFALENNQTTLAELGINQTTFDTIKTEALERSEADAYLQILRGTNWRVTAEICVGYIQRNIDNNTTSWERLGENRSSIEKLYADAWEREPEYALEVLKTTDNYYAATCSALTIRQDIAANITTWNELGLEKSSDLDQFVGRTCKNDSRARLDCIRFTPDYQLANPDYDTLISGSSAGVQQAVDEGITSWAELGINGPAAFTRIVAEAQRKGARSYVENLKSGNAPANKMIMAEKKSRIEEFVAEDIISWRELGLKGPDEFDELANKNL